MLAALNYEYFFDYRRICKVVSLNYSTFEMPKIIIRDF